MNYEELINDLRQLHPQCSYIEAADAIEALVSENAKLKEEIRKLDYLLESK